MKRSLPVIGILCLLIPFLFWGCSGSDGAQGAQGAQGETGGTGPPGPGVVSNESCLVCHGQNNEFAIAEVHRFDPQSGVPKTIGTATVTINSVTFGAPAGDDVPVTIAFTFSAKSAAGTDITGLIDLRTKAYPQGANDNLAFVSFLLAKLTPNANTGSNEWSGFVVNPGATGSSPFRANRPDGVAGAVFAGNPGTGEYSYTFPTSAVRVSDGYAEDVVMRAGVQFSIGGPTISSSNQNLNPVNSSVLNLFSTDWKLQNTSDRRPVANATLDVVNPIGGGVGTPPADTYPHKNDVTTAACNSCHDVLAIHGGGRRETRFCDICHNPKLETAGTGYTRYTNSSLLNMAHRIHSAQNDVVGGEDFSEVAYPQSTGNCLTCHKGTDDYWKTRPTRYACGSCHVKVDFAAGHGPSVPPQTDDAACAICHTSTLIPQYHASKEGAPPTPNNPVVPGTLAIFEYGIDNVTVDNTHTSTITFWVKKDGVFVNFLPSATDNVAVRPSGFSGSPSFLISHAGSAANPQDYSNWDEVASSGFGNPYATGQPRSVNLVGLPITATDNTNTKFQAKLTGANSFPAGAKMRAVALQGYFTQISGGPGLDNVGRHTPSVAKAVTGDAVRRNIVKSGYVDNTGKPVTDPLKFATATAVGCLECHEVFEGHGGSRVNNVQVCVMCHNPQLTTSGRTIPDNVTIAPTVVSKLGSNPLAYPEVAQNMAEMIHGLHSGLGADSPPAGLRERNIRVNNYQIVRNRQETAGVYGVYVDSAEVTYPGDLTHCTKCHYAANPGTGLTAQSYRADLPAGVLFTTEKVTTGNAGESLNDIVAARKSFQGRDPSGNPTDLVDSPLTAKCGYCHDSPAAVGHFISTGGGDVKNTRSTAELAPPKLAPAFFPTP